MKITMTDGRLNVPDEPAIPFIEFECLPRI